MFITISPSYIYWNLLDSSLTAKIPDDILYTRSLTNHCSTNCQDDNIACAGIVIPKVLSMSVKVLIHFKFRNVAFYSLSVKTPNVKSYSSDSCIYDKAPPPRLQPESQSWSFFLDPSQPFIYLLESSRIFPDCKNPRRNDILYTRSLTNHCSTNCQDDNIVCAGIVTPKVLSMSVKVLIHFKFRNVGFNGPQIPHPPPSLP